MKIGDGEFRVGMIRSKIDAQNHGSLILYHHSRLNRTSYFGRSARLGWCVLLCMGGLTEGSYWITRVRPQ